MKKTLLLASIILFSVVSLSYALETDTHEVINEYIVRNILNGFSLNSYLKEELNIEEGIEQLLEKKEIVEWLKEGGKYEDVPPDSAPFIRSVNHFHNPISNKGFSGFFGTGLFSGESALQWSQKPPETQCPGGYYSWHDVRGYFLKALTSPAKTERDENFSRTFRGLGQLMHLVQDMSVPAHTRDDGHLFYNYEKWALINIIDVRKYSQTYFNSSSIGLPNPLAPVPFANLFDTNQYDGANPDITLRDDIGLSEYTNANFFSNDTIFKKFPYPDWSSVSEEIEVSELPDPRDPTGKAKRKYLIKDKHGAFGYRLSRAPYLVKYFDGNISEFIELKLPPVLDDLVYNDYSKCLIPRAVGYSAGLLGYFFRGKLEVKTVEGGFEITNTSKEIMKNGHFELYYDREEGNENKEASLRESITITSGAEVTENNPIDPDGTHTIKFTEPDDVESYVIVYRGGLGNEINSVVGKVKPVNAFYLTLARSDGLVLKDDPDHGVEIQVYNSKKEKLDVEAAYNSEKKRWEIDLEQNEDPGGFYLAYNCAEGIRTEYKGMTAPVEPHFIGEAISPSTIQLVDVIKYWPITVEFTLPEELDTGNLGSSWIKVQELHIWQKSSTGGLIDPIEVHRVGYYNNKQEITINLGDPSYYSRSTDYKDFSCTLAFHAIFDRASVTGSSPLTVFGTVEPGKSYTIPIPYIGVGEPGWEPSDIPLFKPEYEYLGWEGNIEHLDITPSSFTWPQSITPYSPSSLPDIVESNTHYIFTRPNHNYRFRINDFSYETILPEDQGRPTIPVMYRLNTHVQISTNIIRYDTDASWNEYNKEVLVYAAHYESPDHTVSGWIYSTIKLLEENYILKNLFGNTTQQPIQIDEYPQQEFQVNVTTDEWLYDMPDIGDGNLNRVKNSKGNYVTILRYLDSITAKDFDHSETGSRVQYVAIEGSKLAVYPKANDTLRITIFAPSNDYPITINQPYLTMGEEYIGNGYPGIVNEWGYKVPFVVPEGYDFYFNFSYELNHSNLTRFFYQSHYSYHPYTIYRYKKFYSTEVSFVGIGVQKDKMFPRVNQTSLGTMPSNHTDPHWLVKAVGAEYTNGQ